MDKNVPELLPGTLYLLILRIVAAGPTHGYGMAKRIKDLSAEAARTSFPSD